MTSEWCVVITTGIICLTVVACWIIVAGIVGAILEEVSAWSERK